MTEVHVEQGPLDAGSPMVYKDYGHRVRMAFDPERIAEPVALSLLALFLPRLHADMKVVHRAGA